MSCETVWACMSTEFWSRKDTLWRCQKSQAANPKPSMVPVLRYWCSTEETRGSLTVYPEGPYTLLLWNEALEDHPHYGFGDLIPQ